MAKDKEQRTKELKNERNEVTRKQMTNGKGQRRQSRRMTGTKDEREKDKEESCSPKAVETDKQGTTIFEKTILN